MSAFATALRWVRREISPSLLEQAFCGRRYDPIRSEIRYDRRTPVNIEHQITDKIIRGQVMQDLDMVSGTELELKLSDATIERLDEYNSTYYWDERFTGGRTITQALEVTYGYLNNTITGVYGGAGGTFTRSSQLLKSARDIVDTTPMPSGTAYLDIVAHNTVLLNDISPIAGHGILRCTVTNEPNLSNWSPRYYSDFAELVTSAVKAYIYTNLNTEIDIAEIFAGVPLSKITQEIESFSDANAIYKDQLKAFYRLAVYNDRTKRKRMVKLVLGKRPLA